MDGYGELIARDRDQLLVELGAGEFEASPRDALTRGREMYAILRRTLRDVICNNPEVRHLAKEDTREPEIVAALVDLISSQVHGVPAATLAVLLFKDGVPKLCADEWEEHPSA